MTDPTPPMSHRLFIERLVIAIAIAGVALLLWRLRDLLLLVFGAVLVAVILTVIARPFRERLRLPSALALALAVLILLALFGVAFWMFGAEVIGQSAALQESIPRAWQTLLQRLEPLGLAQPLRDLAETSGGVVSRIGGVAMSVGSGLADTLLVLIGGIYFAAQPDFYRRGVLKLVPKRGRGLAADAIDDSGKALRLWLFGRIISMAIVGLLTGIGLWLLGVPAALTLGLVAAILEFIPFLGPLLAAIPALLLAVATDPALALWVAGLYLLIQQIEGNVVEPLVQQRAVSLPPVLLVFGLVSATLIFGAAGIILGAPLTVVLFVLVKRLYIREALDTPSPIPGEDQT
ncbi:MAG TPA: AI-2E family transporter [Allosphingosinicella sp.]|uniref:AI-2E family transporter n=1 Tax=Allosphingosinicella sp. TaxID=2823234 RepID=UPI002ED7E07C